MFHCCFNYRTYSFGKYDNYYIFFLINISYYHYYEIIIYLKYYYVKKYFHVNLIKLSNNLQTKHYINKISFYTIYLVLCLGIVLLFQDQHTHRPMLQGKRKVPCELVSTNSVSNVSFINL